MPSVGMIKLIVIGVVLAAVAGYIGILKFKISDRDNAIIAWQANCTQQETEIGLLLKDQEAKRDVIAALQGQVSSTQGILTKWQTRAAEQDRIIAQLRNVPAGPKQDKKEVVSDEGSAAAIRDLNSGWGAWLCPQATGEQGGVSGGVYALPAASSARHNLTGQW